MSIQEFNSLVIAQQNVIAPYAIKLTKDTESAKDLCQETFCKAFTYREKFQQGTNIKAWLCTIMHNIFVTEVLRNKTRTRITEYLKYDQPTHSSSYDKRMFMYEIQAAIDKLPALFKDMFRMYVSGYKYREIAVHTNKPLTTVKARIRIARLMLQNQISKKDIM